MDFSKNVDRELQALDAQGATYTLRLDGGGEASAHEHTPFHLKVVVVTDPGRIHLVNAALLKSIEIIQS